MSEKVEETNTESFGLPIALFEAAVSTLVELRDTGKMLIFLTPRGFVKLIGDIEDFRQRFGIQSKEALMSLEQAKNAQDEIRRLTALMITTPSNEAALDQMERMHREDFSSESKASLKEEFRRQQKVKIELISRSVVTDAIKQRAKRLATAVGARIEELDYEVVSEREDSYRGKKVDESFLRLRLRYSEGTKSIFESLGFFFGQFGGPEVHEALGFEFECDLSDIDLLLKRLNDAKQRLLQLQESESE